MVHPSIELVDVAGCGARGLVINQSLDLDSITGVPLILLPEDLVISSDVARAGFISYEKKGAAPMADLDDASALALLISHEFTVDSENSFYRPYLDSLPSRPSCAWLNPSLADQDLESMVAKGRLSAEESLKWRQEVERYRISMEAHAEAVSNRYKSLFPITPDLFLNSMGHVLSRSFASAADGSGKGKGGLSLLPLIDLANHKIGFDHPEMISIGGDDQDRCICVSSMFGGEWRPLKSGEELLISYSRQETQKIQIAKDEALMCFLNHSFVFDEIW